MNFKLRSICDQAQEPAMTINETSTTGSTQQGKMSASRRQQHNSRSLTRAPAALQEQFTHTLRRRKHSQSPDSSVVNPFVKYYLFGINFLFMLIGIAFAATGIYILSQKNKAVTSFIDFVFDPACDLCLIGFIIVVIAFFGCGGALRESLLFLKIYHMVLSIFLILEVIVVIFVFIFYFVDGAFANIGLYPEDAFKDAIHKYRDDPDTQGFIDNLQEILSCCGTSNDNEGYLDWNRNPYFNCSDGNDSPEACSVPFSCCKISEGSPKNYRCGAGVLKKSESANLININNEGCLKGLQNVIRNNIWIVGGAILSILIPQAFFICCAKALLSQIYEQMSKW